MPRIKKTEETNAEIESQEAEPVQAEEAQSEPPKVLFRNLTFADLKKLERKQLAAGLTPPTKVPERKKRPKTKAI